MNAIVLILVAGGVAYVVSKRAASTLPPNGGALPPVGPLDPPVVLPPGSEGAVNAVKQEAASEHPLSPTAIRGEPRVLDVSAQMWPDAGLGLGGGVFAQMLTPGWVVVLQGRDGARLTYRTNQTGSTVRFQSEGWAW